VPVQIKPLIPAKATTLKTKHQGVLPQLELSQRMGAGTSVRKSDPRSVPELVSDRPQLRRHPTLT